MTAARPRVLALMLSLAVVGVAAWGFSRPYFRSVFGAWEYEIFVCDCFGPPPMAFSAAWPGFDAGAFRIKAPNAAVLQRSDAAHGLLREPRFTLTYDLSAGARDDTFAKTGEWHYEEEVTIDGKPGVIRTATFTDRAAPEYFELVVPQAVAKDGRWLSLEIRGWMTTADRRWLARQVVTSVQFTPDAPPLPPNTSANGR